MKAIESENFSISEYDRLSKKGKALLKLCVKKSPAKFKINKV